MLLMRTPPPSRGLSLVELMIGITVGLFVVAGAAFMLTNQLHGGRRLMLETQVQQDLRAAADMVVRELRRAGFSPTAVNAAWYRGTPGVIQSGYAPIQAGASEVRFRYGTDSNNFTDDDEEFGFRLDRGVIQFRLGDGGWQPLTDPETLVIDTFTITENLQTIDLNRFCARPCIDVSTGASCGPTQTIREYEIDIAGEAARDPAVQRSLRATVRPRNDLVTGACLP